MYLPDWLSHYFEQLSLYVLFFENLTHGPLNFHLDISSILFDPIWP